MNDDLVDVYESEGLLKAKLIADRLDAAGIRSFIDNVDSPLDGLAAADQMKIVRVLPADVERAQKIIAEFESEA